MTSVHRNNRPGNKSPPPDASIAHNPPPRQRLAQVRVLLPVAVAQAYCYAVPAGMELAAGDIVRVPLSARQCTGVVWDGAAPADSVSEARLRPVGERIAVPPLPEALRRFIDWVAAYTLHPAGAVLRLALSAPEALQPPPPRIGYAAADVRPRPMTRARQRVFAALAGQSPLEQGLLLARAEVGIGVLRGLERTGCLRRVALPAAHKGDEAPKFRLVRENGALSPAQESAALVLRAALAQGMPAGQQGFLLDGVTGSGKTEVYFEALAAALAAGRQVLVLLPEIALTGQFLQRFQARFGVEPLVWHSSLSKARRRDVWRQVALGTARMLVGARSALFLPFAELGLIIVDEEHEQAFKQEDGVLYHARDMAVARAWLGGFPVLLSSATPSLETLVNVERRRFERLCLPQRFGGARQPDIEPVDLRRERPPKGRWLATSLVAALGETLRRGDQSLLFLNRRGYAPVSLCQACGERIVCPHCDSWLVEHRARSCLLCHHCGHRRALLRDCPACGGEETLVACGPGVERIAEETAGLFPDARIEVLSSDGISGARGHQGAIGRIAARQVDIVIGTQIIAKGHHFPHLTLVGVVDGDLGLANGDLRAAERTYQLLHQVIGRCGREERAGRALLQTWMPGHPVMQALAQGDRDRFMAQERQSRARAGLPPFGRLAAVILSGAVEERVRQTADMLAQAAPRGEGFAVLGPAPAPLRRLRRRHRWRFLLRARREVGLQALLSGWLGRVKPPSGVRLVVDVDPYWFG